MFFAIRGPHRYIYQFCFVVQLPWGSIFQLGWGFVPPVAVNKGSTPYDGGPSPCKMNIFALRRRHLPIAFLSKISDKTTDEENGKEDEVIDGGWNSKEMDVFRKKEVPLNSKPPVPEQQERDLFIPIVSLLSIGGFIGLYGYEMLRLYLRGELYLPFLHQ
jgi:hypothetical protein